MSEKLTPAGERWARAKGDRIAGIALDGREHGWPENFVDAAIRIANEQAAEEVAELRAEIERCEIATEDGTYEYYET